MSLRRRVENRCARPSRTVSERALARAARAKPRGDAAAVEATSRCRRVVDENASWPTFTCKKIKQLKSRFTAARIIKRWII
jgi:hypothetical protein